MPSLLLSQSNKSTSLLPLNKNDCSQDEEIMCQTKVRVEGNTNVTEKKIKNPSWNFNITNYRQSRLAQV